jgi:hypothetical protein
MGGTDTCFVALLKAKGPFIVGWPVIHELCSQPVAAGVRKQSVLCKCCLSLNETFPNATLNLLK